jgi:(R,R)-butanediol dehydrogenase/meso-butanediol dehydrogenase/diacetyl reductase/L-iditol 2-dehydrogenase
MGTVESREVPFPEPGDDEVRVRSIYSSFCGSDAHTLTGHLGEFEQMTRSMLPMPFGHEMSGIIDKVGSRAASYGFRKGQNVITNYARYCYSCEQCRSGHENLCANLQFCMNSFAEYGCFHVTQVFQLPEEQDLQTACLIEPLTIALAVAEKAKLSWGKSVAIMGAGGIGLMLVQLARLSGASDITVFDLVEEKREHARRLGADHAFDPRDEGVIEQAIAAAGGKYNCVLEGTGDMSAAHMTLDLLARDGDCVYYAMYGKDPVLSVNLHSQLYWDQKHLHGMLMGAGMFPKAIRMARRMDLGSLIQRIYPLSNYGQAIDDLFTKKFVKIVIKMDE